MGTKLDMSVAFHPQTDGQYDCTIQTLDDMLHACMLSWKGNWEDYLALVEFTYNNNYPPSIKMTLHGVLYGWNCIFPPMCWKVSNE
jgi:hypothetical protein